METKKIYSGWWVLAALFVIYAMTNGVILNTLPLFYPKLIAAFGWTQDVVTRPAQLLFFLVAIFSPLAGNLVDRWPVKGMMLAGGFLLLGGFLLFANVQSVEGLMGAYVLFSLGITLAGIIPSMKIVTNWFGKSRGIAVGILLVGSSLGGALFNPVAGGLIDTYGWRTALLALGALTAVLIFLPLLFFVRIGPDGVRDGDQEKVLASETIQPVSYAALFGSPVFVQLLLITAAMWFCIVGIIQHQALFISDLGTAVSAATVLSTFFIASVLGKVFFGWLSDRYDKKRIMLLAVLNLSLGALILVFIRSNPETLLWLYALVFGIGFSGTFTMIQLLAAAYYQGPSYGKILGVFTMADTLAGVMGILVLGRMRTASGSYDSAFMLLLAIALITAVLVALLPDKQRV